MARKYEYTLTSVEIREFCRKAMTEQLKTRQKGWVFLALLIIADGLLLPEGVGVIALMLALVFCISAWRNYALIRRQVEGQPWTLQMEGGMLKVRRGNYSEMPCAGIRFIRVTRRLLMLGYLQSANRPAWYVMPLRVFANKQEQEAFINQLRNPWQTYAAGGFGGTENSAGMIANATGEAPAQVYLQLSYMLDEEKWVHYNRGAASLIHAGTLGKKERWRAMLLWGGIMAVFIPACVSLAAGGFSWVTAVSGILLALLLNLRLFFRDPEKALRRQIRMPAVAARECGLWQISFSEEGVMAKQPGGMKNLYVWENLGWLVESETAFYLFDRDKRRFVTVAKESFLDWDQVGVLHRLCEDCLPFFRRFTVSLSFPALQLLPVLAG
ncbi:MAG: hypothetical protein NC416_13865 [Eubacterium sp.]|nr:hypothetical protein [Eubacterium sp.]